MEPRDLHMQKRIARAATPNNQQGHPKYMKIHMKQDMLMMETSSATAHVHKHAHIVYYLLCA